MSAILSLAVYLGVVVLLVGFLMLVTHLSGERHFQLGTGKPYESGVPITGSAHLRFAADFYLIAMFFVIFDISAWPTSGKRALSIGARAGCGSIGKGTG
jgi:NADH:ubiquinone oxidoreductase subunit 3 (subunit A)